MEFCSQHITKEQDHVVDWTKDQHEAFKEMAQGAIPLNKQADKVFGKRVQGVTDKLQTAPSPPDTHWPATVG